MSTETTAASAPKKDETGLTPERPGDAGTCRNQLC